MVKIFCLLRKNNSILEFLFKKYKIMTDITDEIVIDKNKNQSIF